MGKTRDLFKKIRDTKGTHHAKMGTVKDRNSMDLTETEDTKKRWQEHMEELYKKDLHDPHNHDNVITNLEPDILECEVKWALESITTNKASGLIKFCQENALVIANTLFQQHKRRLYTWTSPDGQHRNQIDIFFAAKDGEALYSQNLWDAVKAVLRGKFIAIQPYLKK